MKKHKFEYGTVEYRLPDISEAMILMGKMGVSVDKVDSEDNEDLIFIGKLIKNMEPFIGKILVEKDGKQVNNYGECLKSFFMMSALSEIAQEIISCMEVADEKKPRSKKR